MSTDSRISRASTILAAAVLIIAAGRPATASASGIAECRHLLSLTDADLSITSSDLRPADGVLPEHCHVTGLIQPNVGFEAKLPTDWNGKFLHVGNGGFAGSIQDSQSYGLRRAYATAATDTGHVGPDPDFALERGAEVDFGYRAVHVTQAAVKQLIGSYYGHPPRHSYFRGCSTGGRQALVEVQRFPDDFDGVIAGAPIYDFSLKQAFNAAWVTHALFGDDRAGYLPPAKLRTLRDAVYDKCDAIDGLEDGLIDDPRRCNFTPRRDLAECMDGRDSSGCFTAAQIAAIEKIYDGPGDHYNREGSYPGHVPGAEWMQPEDAAGASFTGGWDLYLLGRIGSPPASPDRTGLDSYLDSYGGDPFLPVQYRNAVNFFRYFAFSPDRPDFDVLRDLDFSAMPERFASEATVDAADADLSRFHARGGKLILWHGWADAGLIPIRTIQYYEEVRAALGGARTDRFVRLFMAPGVYHCEGGPGPDLFDDLSALEAWVERDEPPERITAYKMPAMVRPAGYISERMGLLHPDEALFSRPLCAYPRVARYDGNGDMSNAESFLCVEPEN